MHFVELSKRQHMDQNDELWAWAEFLKAPNSEHLKWRYEESKESDETIQSIIDAQEIFQRAVADPIEQEYCEAVSFLNKKVKDKITRENSYAIA